MKDIAVSAGVRTPETLEELLDAMAMRGSPRVCRSDDGTWYAMVDMFVSATGASFNVKSEFKHPTHVSAARQCHQRMVEALERLGVRA